MDDMSKSPWVQSLIQDQFSSTSWVDFEGKKGKGEGKGGGKGKGKGKGKRTSSAVLFAQLVEISWENLTAGSDDKTR